MMPERTQGPGPTIGDDAVLARTGKAWAGWFRVLDRAGAKRMDHEQARGLRDVHEKPGGYEIGRSKTIAASLEQTFTAWSQLRTRRRWLQDPEFMKAYWGRNLARLKELLES
jgi:hypothetical protein